MDIKTSFMSDGISSPESYVPQINSALSLAGFNDSIQNFKGDAIFIDETDYEDYFSLEFSFSNKEYKYYTSSSRYIDASILIYILNNILLIERPNTEEYFIEGNEVLYFGNQKQHLELISKYETPIVFSVRMKSFRGLLVNGEEETPKTVTLNNFDLKDDKGYFLSLLKNQTGVELPAYY